MPLQAEFPPQPERQLAAILHHLPPERQTQLLAFARFLAYETFQTTDIAFLDLETGTGLDEPLTEDDAHWDALLASPEGQQGLEKLASQALAEIRGRYRLEGEQDLHHSADLYAELYDEEDELPELTALALEGWPE